MDPPDDPRQRHRAARRRTRHRAAGAAAARLPDVLVDLAPATARPGRRRLPGGRGGPARLRRQRQAAARLRRHHPGRRHRAAGRPRSASSDAVMVGNDLGGLLAWTVAAQHPQVVRRIAVLGAAHPLRLRAARSLTDRRGQRRASAYALGTFQMPALRRRLLTRDDRLPAPAVRQLERARAGRHGRATPRASRRYAEAMRIHPVGALLAGVLPLAGPLDCRGRTAGRYAESMRAADRPPGAATARRPRRLRAAGTAQGSSPLRQRRLRVAAADRRRPLPAARGAGAGRRRLIRWAKLG